MSKLNIYLFDNSNNTKEELNINKPNTYQELLNQLRQKYQNITNYDIFILDDKNNEIKINDEKYNLLNNFLFIRENNKMNLEQSINFDELSESKQNILDDKYACKICTVIIKKENPLFCYKCQKIFHEKCLKYWEEKCREQNKNFSCPNCRNELSIENWNKKLNFEDNRKEDGNLMNTINEQNNMIQKYEVYIRKSINMFKNTLDEINFIHKLFNFEKNEKLNNMVNTFPLTFTNLEIDELNEVISDELKKFKFHLINNNEKNKLIDINNYNEIINEIEMEEKEQTKNKINLIYFAKKKGNYNILGKKFIENNKDNIELYINYKKINLSNDNCLLQKGDNIITLITKKKLNNLSYMFHQCDALKDITELKYLDVSETKDFSYMFSECSILSDLKPLINWNVSNGEKFEYMFSECTSLFDLKGLQNWNVSNGKDLGSMFFGCSSLSDLNHLQNWNVVNCACFDNMFRGCSSLKDIKALKNWNVLNGTIFKSMFSGCALLSDIYPLKNWNFTKCENLESMFYGCSSLSDLEPLNKWNVSTCQYFTSMFYGCISLIDLSPLKNWDLSKAKNLKKMFFGCLSITNIDALENWKKYIVNYADLVQKEPNSFSY